MQSNPLTSAARTQELFLATGELRPMQAERGGSRLGRSDDLSGFYLMHRGWLEHPVFGSRKREPFDRRSAWCWMIEEAAFADRPVRVGGKIVTVSRGQFSHSLRFMAEAWGWQHDRCRRFLKELSHVAMIATASATGDATGQMLVTICNYEKYQDPTNLDATENATVRAVAVRQQCDSSATDYKEGKELKEKKTLGRHQNGDARKSEEDQEDTGKAEGQDEARPAKPGKAQLDREFDVFWKRYQRKTAGMGPKTKARQQYEICRRTETAEEILVRLDRYHRQTADADEKYRAQPVRFLSGGYGTDDAASPEPWRDTGPDEPPPAADWTATTPTGRMN